MRDNGVRVEYDYRHSANILSRETHSLGIACLLHMELCPVDPWENPILICPVLPRHAWSNFLGSGIV